MCCVFGYFWGVVVFAHFVCVECGFRMGFEDTHQHASAHISIHTLHSLPFSHHISHLSPQKTPAGFARQTKNKEWKKCVELLEVRGDVGGRRVGI